MSIETGPISCAVFDLRCDMIVYIQHDPFLFFFYYFIYKNIYIILNIKYKNIKHVCL
jgi:hypothetical protein